MGRHAKILGESNPSLYLISLPLYLSFPPLSLFLPFLSLSLEVDPLSTDRGYGRAL